MDYRYGQFDGVPFPSPDDLFPSPKVIDFILQWGDQALEAMDNFEEDEYQELIEQMIEAGLLERDDQTGALRLTPKMLRGIQHHALLEIFQGVKRGTREGHETYNPGRGDERSDGTKPYEFGDPVSELDLATTLRNAIHHRQPDPSAKTRATIKPPIHVHYDDFELYQSEGQTDVALCILLDMSGSMMRWGRFYQAKRVALGMEALIRGKYPQDTIDYVGFYSLASRITSRQLPLVMPKPVSIYDSQVRLRVALEQAEKNQDKVPQHFTNLQLGLRTARRVLGRRGATEKQIFIITDGQPTAHVEPGKTTGAEMLYLLYPPTERTATATLKEALRCQQQGIRIATFALIEDYWGMDWVGFVDQLTRLTRGVAFYCSSDDLSSTVIESYLSGKKRKSFIA